MVGKMTLMRSGSRSKRPASKRPPAWVVYQPDEVEAFVITLSREGRTPSEIGSILRDEYGVPLVKPIVGKGVLGVLRGAGFAPKFPEDLGNLMARAANLRRHLERNPKDQSNKRGLQLLMSKIYRLARHYRRKGLLPEDWRYTESVTI